MTVPPVLLVADFRSPHALAWASRLVQMQVCVRGVSSRRLLPDQRRAAADALRGGLVHEADDLISRSRARLTQSGLLQTARGVLRGTERREATSPASHARPEGTGALELRLELRVADRLTSAIRHHARPSEVVHALRIPFEAISAAGVARTHPLAVSVWGQDLVRQAPANPLLGAHTRRTLAATRGLHADCVRDLELAKEWGLPDSAPRVLAAGTMGPDDEVFQPPANGERDIIFCPRGPGTHIEHRVFLEAVENVLRRHPRLSAVAANMKGDGSSENFVARSALGNRIHLEGRLGPREMASAYGRSVAVVSPSRGDGTPNTLLEAMACEAVVLAADIPSVRSLLEPVYEPGLFTLGAHELEEALEAVLRMPAADRAETGVRGRQVVMRDWGFEATRDRIGRWYEDVVR